ncbi:MAG: DNA mismatch repair endonuclease MutL, partial [bacterium]|nr:DNA mismatch repair endonuclease MutL [bacterium]
KGLISVIDNGQGMSYDDALLSIERFGTSKIFTVSDLKNISTLGFRGEALPSISAVSQFEMITTERGEMLGTRIIIMGGEVKDVEEVGGKQGTTVNIKNLFYNIPARRKFLRSETTENIYNLDIMTKFALRYHELSFRYLQEGKEIFNFSKQDKLKDRILKLLGDDLGGENLIEISNQNDDMSITGYVGKPFLNSSNYGKQYIFINGRIVRDRIIRNALDGAYEGYLMKNRYPVGVLDLRIRPDLIDVNVHPQKMEIRFYSPTRVREFIVTTIKSAIASQKELISSLKFQQLEGASNSSVPNDIPVQEQLTNLPSEEKIDSGVEISGSTESISKTEIKEAKGIFSGFRYIGQVLESYLVFSKSDEVYLMDQHAAAERVNYERMADYDNKHQFPSQILLFPIDLDLSMSEAEFLKENLGVFKELGLEIELVGNSTFVITSVPALLDPDFSPRDFKDIFEQVFEFKEKTNIPQLKDEIIKSMACKGSIRANRIILPEEVEELLRELDRTENPYNCPHGRPTIVKLTKKEIEKMFKRII